MLPIKLTNATRTLAEDQPEYLSLDIVDEVTNGVPQMISMWALDAEELAVLNEGGFVVLALLGTQHPPVVVRVQPYTPSEA